MYNIKIRNVNQNQIKTIANKYNLNENVVKLLLGRGYNEEYIELLTASEVGLINPHNSFKFVEEAAYEIAEYIQNDDAKIYIYGDYDSDGINAGFIIGDCIKQLITVMESKCELEVCLPNRSDGYGLSLNWCEHVYKDSLENNKNALVITVDNGITKREEAEYLINHNINVIITDHHVPKEGYVPENCLVVDPWLNDLDNEDAKGLCGAAVAYKICAYLLEDIYKDTSEYHLLYVPHVAIATITDMMPITKENIAFVKYGLTLIEQEYCTDGILHYKNFIGKSVTPKDIAFELGPQLNACGRMGRTEVAGDLFFGCDDSEIDDVYNEIFNINVSRKEKEKEIIEEIFSRSFDDNDKILITYVEDLGGLGGSVASKIVEKYQKPVILLTGDKDLLHGSARSFGNLDLQEIFAQEVKNGNMIDFGVHHAAAGVYIKKNKIKSLQDSLNKQLENISIENIEEETTIFVDGELTLSNINKKTAEIYNGIPFFNDLKEPVYVIPNVTIHSTSTSKNNPNNICFNMTDDTVVLTKNKYNKMVGKEFWAWGYTPKYEALGSPKKVNVIGQVVQDFRNPKYYTLQIIDMVPAI